MAAKSSASKRLGNILDKASADLMDALPCPYPDLVAGCFLLGRTVSVEGMTDVQFALVGTTARASVLACILVLRKKGIAVHARTTKWLSQEIQEGASWANPVAGVTFFSAAVELLDKYAC